MFSNDRRPIVPTRKISEYPMDRSRLTESYTSTNHFILKVIDKKEESEENRIELINRTIDITCFFSNCKMIQAMSMFEQV
jgi:hypothetical protein